MPSYYKNKKPNDGKEGERLAKQWLEGQGYAVQDVSGNSVFWGQDIDLIATRGNDTVTIEVKWDNIIANTGNLYVETITDIDKQKQGWFGFCCADMLMYGSKKERLFYVIRVSDLHEYIDNHPLLEERKAVDWTGKVSKGKLVPIKEFSQNYHVQIVKL